LIRFRARLLILGLLGIVVALALGAVVLLFALDWRPLIERSASRALGRPLSIASLRIVWRNPLGIELTGLRLANAGWGSQPDMLRVAKVSAAIDVPALLHGTLRFRRLRLDKPMLLLERNPEGVGNWHFKAGGPPGGFAIVPRNRTEFPTLIDFALHDGVVIYRATSSDLRIDLDDLAMAAADDEQPVTLRVDGAYNGVRTHLAATMKSYAALRDSTVPFGTEFSLASDAATIGFSGTMKEPLDFDGVRGQLRIETAKLGDLLRLFGAEASAGYPFKIAGRFARDGDHWQLAETKGFLAADAFDGGLSLAEAGRGAADDLGADLRFARLDLAPLLGSVGDGPVRLQLEKSPAVNVDARIAANTLTYEARHLADFAIAARTRAGQVAVSNLSFAFAGGRVAASGAAQSTADGSRITVDAMLSDAKAGSIAQALDGEGATGSAAAGPAQIAGRLDGRLTLEMTGATLAAALKTSRGAAVLGMVDGRISRDLLERASTDLRTLFRKGEGWAQLTCALGTVRLQDGIATIATLRLRTPDTTLTGEGRVDLAGKNVDVTVQTESGATSLLALRLPIRISGTFDALSVAPSFSAPNAQPIEGNPGRLTSPALQRLVDGNPCRR
jgi:AsmA family protein